MRILVTGAAGFIGSKIANRMLAEGHEVTGIDVLTDYYDRNLKIANLKTIEHKNFQLVQEDLNRVDIKSLLTGVDQVYHQAGQPGVRKSWGSDFGDYVTANISATQRLLEAIKHVDSVNSMVYASSSSVYGDAESFPTREDSATRPRSPYGVSKLAAEHLCSLYAANFGVPTVSLRYFTVYGPGQRPDMAFTRFLRSALLDEEIVIYGDGRQIRDFTFVEDIVNANILAASTPVKPGSIFNVAGGSNVSVLEVLDIIRGLVGKELRIRHADPVAGDVIRTGGATDEIKAALKWEPKTDLRTGLALQLDWARNHFGQSEHASDRSVPAHATGI